MIDKHMISSATVDKLRWLARLLTLIFGIAILFSFATINAEFTFEFTYWITFLLLFLFPISSLIGWRWPLIGGILMIPVAFFGILLSVAVLIEELSTFRSNVYALTTSNDWHMYIRIQLAASIIFFAGGLLHVYLGCWKLGINLLPSLRNIGKLEWMARVLSLVAGTTLFVLYIILASNIGEYRILFMLLFPVFALVAWRRPIEGGAVVILLAGFFIYLSLDAIQFHYNYTHYYVHTMRRIVVLNYFKNPSWALYITWFVLSATFFTGGVMCIISIWRAKRLILLSKL